MFGQDVFSAIAKSGASADDGVPEMKGEPASLYAEVHMATATVPFVDFLQDFYHPPKALNYQPESNAVNPLL